MGTILKLLLVLAILNAAFRGAQATWDYYQLKDDAEQVVVFGQNTPTGELHAQILAKATEAGVPLQPENLTVERMGNRTVATAVYTQPIEFFPSVVRPVTFSFTVNGMNVTALNPAP